MEKLQLYAFIDILLVVLYKNPRFTVSEQTTLTSQSYNAHEVDTRPCTPQMQSADCIETSISQSRTTALLPSTLRPVKLQVVSDVSISAFTVKLFTSASPLATTPQACIPVTSALLIFTDTLLIETVFESSCGQQNIAAN